MIEKVTRRAELAEDPRFLSRLSPIVSNDRPTTNQPASQPASPPARMSSSASSRLHHVMRRLYPTSQDIQEKNQRSRARGQRRGGGGGVGIAEDGESQPARQRRYDEEKALPMPALTPVQPKRARISPTGGLKVHWARFKVRGHPHLAVD